MYASVCMWYTANVNWRASWKNRICSTTMKLRKSLVKPVTWQKACNYVELFGSSAQDRHVCTVAWICHTSTRNISQHNRNFSQHNSIFHNTTQHRKTLQHNINLSQHNTKLSQHNKNFPQHNSFPTGHNTTVPILNQTLFVDISMVACLFYVWFVVNRCE